MEPAAAVGMIFADSLPVAIATCYSGPAVERYVAIVAFAAPHYCHSCHSTSRSLSDSKLK